MSLSKKHRRAGREGQAPEPDKDGPVGIGLALNRPQRCPPANTTGHGMETPWPAASVYGFPVPVQ